MEKMYTNQNITQAQLPEEETEGTAAKLTKDENELPKESFGYYTLGMFPSNCFAVSRCNVYLGLGLPAWPKT